MKLTDLFIRRPVLATVVSLLILVLGLRALGTLQVLQYPKTQNAVVTISTVYYGADPQVVAGFHHHAAGECHRQANGIDYRAHQPVRRQ
jgi:multidrug efflux pump